MLKVTEAAPFETIEVQLTKWKQLLDDTPHHLMQNKFAELAKVSELTLPLPLTLP